jgi:hypothetical protein
MSTSAPPWKPQTSYEKATSLRKLVERYIHTFFVHVHKIKQNFLVYKTHHNFRSTHSLYTLKFSKCSLYLHREPSVMNLCPEDFWEKHVVKATNTVCQNFITSPPCYDLFRSVKQIRNRMHSVTTLVPSSEFDPRPLQTVPVTSELSGVNCLCVRVESGWWRHHGGLPPQATIVNKLNKLVTKVNIVRCNIETSSQKCSCPKATVFSILVSALFTAD